MKITTYKEHEIECSESGEFSAEGVSGKHATMEAMKAAIDAATKIKYKPQPGLLIGGFDYFNSKIGISEVTVTRPHGHESRGQFWITTKDKKRATSGTVVCDTPANRVIADEIARLQKEKQVISTLLDKTVKSLDRNFKLVEVK
jgi:hypothetical protein